MDFQAVVLAGGNGSRMYPLIDDLPKAMLPIANRLLFNKFNFTNFLINFMSKTFDLFPIRIDRKIKYFW